jgi:hypothetical protein
MERPSSTVVFHLPINKVYFGLNFANFGMDFAIFGLNFDVLFTKKFNLHYFYLHFYIFNIKIIQFYRFQLTKHNF